MIHVLASKVVYIVGLISYKIYSKFIGKKKDELDRKYIYAIGSIVLFIGILLFAWIL